MPHADEYAPERQDLNLRPLGYEPQGTADPTNESAVCQPSVSAISSERRTFVSTKSPAEIDGMGIRSPVRANRFDRD
jgi:hypothetical protein